MNISSPFFRFLRTAPVITTIWFIITAFILIEINHFYPDVLTFAQF